MIIKNYITIDLYFYDTLGQRKPNSPLLEDKYNPIKTDYNMMERTIYVYKIAFLEQVGLQILYSIDAQNIFKNKDAKKVNIIDFIYNTKELKDDMFESVKNFCEYNNYSNKEIELLFRTNKIIDDEYNPVNVGYDDLQETKIYIEYNYGKISFSKKRLL